MSETRTGKSIKNILFNLTNQIVTLILNFVSRTVFIHTLGIEYLGLNGIFSDVLGMLSMADLGLNTAMVYSFYKPIADNNTKKISALITFYNKVYNVIAIAITIIGISLIPFLRLIVNTENDIPLLEVYYLFSLASVIISYLFVYKTSIITADQKNYIVTKINIIVNTIKTILQIILLLIFKNYIIYLTIGVLGNLLNNYIASRKAIKLYPYINNKEQISQEEKKSIFDNLKSVFLYKVSSVMLNATDNMLISIIIDTTMVGYYSNYLMLNNKIFQIFSLIFTSLTASIGNIIVKEKAQKRYEIFECEQSISFIACGIVVPCFFNLANDLVGVWLGTDFVLSNGVVLAISLNMYLACVMQPLWSYREATGLYRKTKYVMLICAIINFILSIAFGKLIGLAGIILASAVSRILTYFWFEPNLLFKEYFERSSIKYYFGIVLNILFIFTLGFILYYFSKNYTPTNWLYFVIKALVLFIISCVASILVYKKSQGFIIIRKKLIRR